MSELEIENYFAYVIKHRPPIFYIDILGILTCLSSLFYGITVTIHVIMASFLDIMTILTTGFIFCHLEMKIKKESTLSIFLTIISLFTTHLVKIYVIQHNINMKLIQLFLSATILGFTLKFREQLIDKLASHEYVFDIVTKSLLFCSILMVAITEYSY